MMISFIGIIFIALVLLAVVGLIIALVVITTGSRRHVEQGSNPNFAPCPGCQQLAPLDAKTCPHCGRTQ